MQRWHHGNFANSMYEQVTGIPMYKGKQPTIDETYYNAIVKDIIHNRTEQIIGGTNYIRICMMIFYGYNPTMFMKNHNWYEQALMKLPAFIDRECIETTAQANAKERLETIERCYNELFSEPVRNKIKK